MPGAGPQDPMDLVAMAELQAHNIFIRYLYPKGSGEKTAVGDGSETVEDFYDSEKTATNTTPTVSRLS